MPAPDFGGLLARAKAPSQSMTTPKVPGMKPTPEVPEVEGGEDPMLTRLKPIAQDAIAAIRGGDAAAFAEALIAAHGAIGSGPSDAESEIE